MARHPLLELAFDPRGPTTDVYGDEAWSMGERLARTTPWADGPAEDGIHAGWRFDDDLLEAWNDRYGLQPLFVRREPDRIALSPSLGRLARRPGRLTLDEPAMAVFLRLGYFLAEDTPFVQIRSLPPRARLRWSHGHEALAWELPLGQPRPDAIGRVDAVIDEYLERFRAAIARRSPGDQPFALGLSGGKDSRHILFELLRQGQKPALAVTVAPFPPFRPEDVRIARRIAHELCLEHVILDAPESRLRTEWAKNARTQFCADEHAWFLPMARYLAGRVGLVFDGIGGDVLSESSLHQPRAHELLLAGRWMEAAEVLLPASREQLIRDMLPASAGRRFSRSLALERLVEELRRHEGSAYPLGAFQFWNRTRREIALAPYALFSRGIQVHSPFLDQDLFDFLSGLPAEIVLRERIHTRAIERGYPEFRHIPYDTKGIADERGSYRELRFARELATMTLRSRSRFLSSGYIVPRSVRSLLDTRYRAAIGGFGPLAVYLLQLERLLDRCGGEDRA